jgi:hypothetical protein
MFLARNSMPQKDADVGDDGASAKGAAGFYHRFGQGVGQAISKR